MKRSKSLSMITVLVLMVNLFIGAVGNMPVIAADNGCTTISTPQGLNDIRDRPDGNYCLTKDIDLGEFENWVPIPDFTGTLDGQNHTISHITINNNNDTGLFGRVEKSGNVVLKNLVLDKVNINGGAGVGSLIGYLKNGTVSNVHVKSGTVIGSDQAVGGLIGRIDDASVVESSSANVNVTGSGKHIGGLIGRNSYGGKGELATIKDSFATGEVEGKSAYVGGLIGSLNNGIISNSYATGAVNGESDGVGGLIGIIDSGTISESYATGKVTGSGRHVGGLIGRNSSSASIENSHATGDVIGNDFYVGGLMGSLHSGTVSNSYATGTINGQSENVGGLIGIMDNGTISESYARGTVTGSKMSVGGLLGKMSKGLITESYAEGTVNGKYQNTGGLIGLMVAGNVKNSHATGDVTGADNVAGGLVGQMMNGTTITDSYALGNVHGVYYIGGLVGNVPFSGTVQNSYAGGSVSGDGPYTGGLVGGFQSGMISQSFAYGDVHGNGYVGGLVGVAFNGHIEDSWALQKNLQTSSSDTSRIGRVAGGTGTGVTGLTKQNWGYQNMILKATSSTTPVVSAASDPDGKDGRNLDAIVVQAEGTPSFDNIFAAYRMVQDIPYDPPKQELLDRLKKLGEAFKLNLGSPGGIIFTNGKLTVQGYIMGYQVDSLNISATFKGSKEKNVTVNSVPSEQPDSPNVSIEWDFQDDNIVKGVFENPVHLHVESTKDSSKFIDVEWKKTIVIDKEFPILTINMKTKDNQSYLSGKITAQPVTVSASAMDTGSGIQRLSYSLDGGNTWQDYTDSLQFDESGNYSVDFKAIDRAGNVTEKSVAIKVVLEAPPMSFVDSEEVQTGSDSSTFTIPMKAWDAWGQDITVSATIGGVTRSQKLESPPNMEPTSANVFLAWTGKELPEGIYSNIDVKVVGENGKQESHTYNGKFIVDKQGPESPTIYMDSNGWTNADSVKITVKNGDDGLSGVERTEYKIGDSGEWKTYNNAFDISSEGQTNIYARTFDKAGNQSQAEPVVVKIDRTAPGITLKGDDPLTLEVGTDYTELGATATDNVSTNLKVAIDKGDLDTNVLGDYDVIYRVTDEAGNTTTKTRTVKIVDTTKPELTLIGDADTVIEVGSEFTEPGFIAFDNYDGNITNQVQVLGEVDATKIGTYTIAYNVVDSSGNKTSKTRAVHVIDTTKPIIHLKGTNPLIINYGDDFEEPGYSVSDNSGEDLQNQVKVKGEIATSKLGTGTLYYSVEDSSGNKTTVARTVIVKDEEQPMITLLGDNPSTVEVGTKYVEPGYKARDNYDGDITDKVEIVSNDVNTDKLGDYEIHYKVEDSSGNLFETVRQVKVVDTTPPEITLNESQNLKLEVNQEYQEKGATARDNYDGDITNKIKIEGSVNTKIPGVYTVTYRVTDSSGNTAVTKRTVTVVGIEGIEMSNPPLAIDVDQVVDLRVIVKYTDGTIKDITSRADVKVNDPEALKIENGKILGLKSQLEPVKLVIDYEGKERTFSFYVVDQHANLGVSKRVKGGDLFWVQGSHTFIKMPDDLPFGTRIKITRPIVNTSVLTLNGDIFQVQLGYPDGMEPLVGRFQLFMGTGSVNEDAISKTGIYTLNEHAKRWEYVGGWNSLSNGLIAASVPHFSIYGVFTDLEGPSQFTLKTKYKTDKSIMLTFGSEDPSGVKEYKILRDGQIIAILNGDQTTYLDEGLDAQTAYTYTIVATDKLGNTNEIRMDEVTAVSPTENQKGNSGDGHNTNAGGNHSGSNKGTTNDSGSNDTNNGQMPQTATSMYSWVFAGLVLLITGLFILNVLRKNRSEESRM